MNEKSFMESFPFDKLSEEELINGMLLFCKEASKRNIIKTQKAITLAISNGIFHGDTHKSLGYEDMSIAFGMAFREIENVVEEKGNLESLNYVMVNSITDDEVYH